MQIKKHVHLLVLILSFFTSLLPNYSYAQFKIKSLDCAKSDSANSFLVPFKGELSFVLTDEEGQILCDVGGNRPMMVASALKIVTTYLALEILGPQFQFTTNVYYNGELTNGVLNGDLIIEGDGGPILLTEHVMNIALQIKNFGIKKVTGNIFYLANNVVEYKFIDPFQKTHYSYNSGVGALNALFNRANIVWDGKNPLNYFLIPAETNLNLIAGTHSRGIEDPFIFDKGNYHQLTYAKDLPVKGEEEIPIQEPSHFALEVLWQQLKMVGIELSGRVPENALINNQNREQLKLKLIYTFKSKDLIDLIDLLLEFSNNVIAESIFNRVGIELIKKSNEKQLKNTLIFSREIIVEEINNFLKKEKLLENFIIVNGSGYSTQNLVSASSFASLIARIANKSYQGRSFITLLPIGGVKGSIGNYMKTKEMSGRVWAKPGTMNYISSLAGSIFSKSNKTYYFVLLLNNQAAREELDKSVGTSKELHYLSNAKSWMWSAKAYQNSLLTEIIEK